MKLYFEFLILVNICLFSLLNFTIVRNEYSTRFEFILKRLFAICKTYCF